jgi:hypothetical protein
MWTKREIQLEEPLLFDQEKSDRNEDKQITL